MTEEQAVVDTWLPRTYPSTIGGVIAALVCIGAGVFMLVWWSATKPPEGTTSWFDIMRVGIGVYFIGKGLFVGVSTIRQAEQVRLLERLVELAALRHYYAGRHQPNVSEDTMDGIESPAATRDQRE